MCARQVEMLNVSLNDREMIQRTSHHGSTELDYLYPKYPDPVRGLSRRHAHESLARESARKYANIYRNPGPDDLAQICRVYRYPKVVPSVTLATENR